jgi:hypothetical protein
LGLFQHLKAEVEQANEMLCFNCYSETDKIQKKNKADLFRILDRANAELISCQLEMSSLRFTRTNISVCPVIMR